MWQYYWGSCQVPPLWGELWDLALEGRLHSEVECTWDSLEIITKSCPSDDHDLTRTCVLAVESSKCSFTGRRAALFLAKELYRWTAVSSSSFKWVQSWVCQCLTPEFMSTSSGQGEMWARGLTYSFSDTRITASLWYPGPHFHKWNHVFVTRSSTA